MATASVGQPTVVNARRPSQFSQFRLTQFVNNSQPVLSNATDARATTTPTAISTTTSTQVQDIDSMAQVSRPPSGQNLEHTPAIAPSRPVPPDLSHANSSPSGVGQHLELVELVTNSSNEGILGPNKDGRVRNPVPSKLKGKTDNKQGNFGVMSMGQSPGKKTEAQGRESAAERDAAARRTSENTASRAKAAQQEKYVPPKKRGLEANYPVSRVSPFAVSKNDDRNRARPLAPDETKFEQARLLTLLRSINPVTVVDQICKAVAYFGGIPGAPPPEDGIFPESANTRETGALFIGWVAEIFPDLSSRSPEATTKDIPQNALPKKKGRPSTGKKSVSLSDFGGQLEQPNSRNGYGYGPAVSAPAWGLPQSLALVNTPVPGPVLAEAASTAGSVLDQTKPVEPHPATPVKGTNEDADNISNSKRRRGRPKGSRNKAVKGDGQQSVDTSGQTNVTPAPINHGLEAQQPQPSPKQISSITPNTTVNKEPAAFANMGQVQTNQQTQPQSYQYPPSAWPTNASKTQAGQPELTQSDGLSPEERAVLEAFRHQGQEAAPSAILPPGSTKDLTGAPTGEKKRKRVPAKPKAPPAVKPPTPATVNQVGQLNTQNASTPAVNHTAPSAMSQDHMQWPAVAAITPTLPPAKKPRQRKPKASSSSNDITAKSQAGSVISNATPTMAPSTIPDSQATASQQSLPTSRPPADGLEAHYERFVNLQQTNIQQQNGRSHTPIQATQQMSRQQSKAASTTPQQSTPLLQHQQMQQQKSQQGNQQTLQGNQQALQGNQQALQRDDQKLTQGSSSRSSSATFYNTNHRTQPSASYNNQYSSHQPSQLYPGHQTSPQLSNNNSYRPPSVHNTLAQASPQFPQQESSYRTASPHTIAQPSPSFSQGDNTFRATNPHSLAQPTAPYSQAENSYRTNTHALTQPTSTYPPARAQPQTQTQNTHQSHYSNFPDNAYLDLPTLESLGHSGSTSNTGVSLTTGGYGPGIGVGLGTSRATGSSNSIYGTSSGLSSAFDTSSNDYLRGVSRPGTNTNPVYGTTSSGLGSFDTSSSNSELDMRDRLLRGMGRR